MALATIAAVVGPKIKVRHGRDCHGLGFNVIVSHQTPRTLPWFDVIVAPFVGKVFEMQLALVKYGAARIEEEIARQRKELEQVVKSIQPDVELVARLRANLDRAPARLKPLVASSSAVPKDLARLLPESFDGGVVLVGVGSDPGADLLRLKAPERAHLAELLSRSWEGAPLSFGRVVQEAHLSLLWQTQQPLKHLLGKHGFEPAFLAVPTLILHDESEAKRIPTLPCESGWKHICGEIFDVRCLNRETVFTLSAEAEVALATFTRQVAEKLPGVPAALRPHLAWLPDLTARLAVLCWILAARQEVVVASNFVDEAIRMTRWFGRAHLLAAAAAILPTDTTDHADKTSVLLAKIRAKAPITRRDLRRCFDNQRVGWFDTALDTLVEEKKVRYDDSACLVTCP